MGRWTGRGRWTGGLIVFLFLFPFFFVRAFHPKGSAVPFPISFAGLPSPGLGSTRPASFGEGLFLLQAT